MTGLLLVFVGALVASAFFSATEMAFVSGNKLKFREMADAGDSRAQFIMRLHRNPDYFLTMILIGNNVANVTATAILTYFFQDYLGWTSEWLVMAIMVPVLVVLAEMVPKDYGRLRAISFLSNQVFWLKWLQKICYPPIVLFLKLTDLILPSLQKRWQRDIFVNEKEFRSLIEESTHRGVVGPQEEKLIHTILDFERIQVHSVMIRVEQTPMVDISCKIGDVKRIARQTQAKMLLVYEEIPSIIMGMIYVFDILWEEEDTQGLHDFLRAPIFIPETTSIEKAFLTLQQKRQSYAVVINRAGNVQGVVPIERLLMLEKH